MVKNPRAMQETWVMKVSWRREWQPSPVFFPGESPLTEVPGGLTALIRLALTASPFKLT